MGVGLNLIKRPDLVISSVGWVVCWSVGHFATQVLGWLAGWMAKCLISKSVSQSVRIITQNAVF